MSFHDSQFTQDTNPIVILRDQQVSDRLSFPPLKPYFIATWAQYFVSLSSLLPHYIVNIGSSNCFLSLTERDSEFYIWSINHYQGNIRSAHGICYSSVTRIVQRPIKLQV